MISLPTNPDPKLAALQSLTTGIISDAMEELDLERKVIVGLFPVVHSASLMAVGRACTLTQRRKPSGASRTQSMVRQREISDGVAKAGDFVVIETGGIVDVATWGDNHSLRCRLNGVVGMLTDGAVRDPDGIRAQNFPVFCKGYSPVKSRWDLETVGLNESVTLNGVDIVPGDVICADECGVVVIPQADLDAVAELALKLAGQEAAYQTNMQGHPTRR